jgi:hypothetical protein
MTSFERDIRRMYSGTTVQRSNVYYDFVFHIHTVHLDIIKIFYAPIDAQVNCLKNNFKIYIKIDSKTTPTCFGVITIIRERIIRACSSSCTRPNNALPDDDDYTETCWSCFNVSFNVNFKIVFKTIHLCISWWIKNWYVKMITFRRGNIQETNFLHDVFRTDFKSEGKIRKRSHFEVNFSEKYL